MGLGHARFGVFVAQHRGACCVQIGVIVCVIEMPVRVDYYLYGRIAQPIERFFKLRPARLRNAPPTIFPSGPFNTTTFLPGLESNVRFSGSGRN